MAGVKESYFWHNFCNGRPNAQLRMAFPAWTATCFHAPGYACDCRKPKLGLWERDIRPVFNMRASESWLVEADQNNLEFGRALGVNLALITGAESDSSRDVKVFGSLHHFAETLLEKKIPWAQVTMAPQRQLV